MLYKSLRCARPYSRRPNRHLRIASVFQSVCLFVLAHLYFTNNNPKPSLSAIYSVLSNNSLARQRNCSMRSVKPKSQQPIRRDKDCFGGVNWAWRHEIVSVGSVWILSFSTRFFCIHKLYSDKMTPIRFLVEKSWFRNILHSTRKTCNSLANITVPCGRLSWSMLK